MTLPLIVLLPLIGAVLPVLFVRWSRDASAWSAGAVTAAAFVLLLRSAPRVLAGGVPTASWPWIPEIGLNVSFMLDGLGLLFAFLILGIGLLIVLYTRFYLPADDPLGRFYAYLLLFMGAMLGIVLSDSLILLVVFWELTSISSFLLIGFWSDEVEGREGARMALAVTAAGGLALLAGVLIVGRVVGSYELSVVLGSRELLEASPLYSIALVLVLLGAFTKSAQFPFHFWLPHAMAAPTPVSAYLHSATMVKAGIFLLARLFPVFAGTTLWFYIVGGVGLLTLTLAAYWAIFKHDLKALLAYSTVSHLGLMTLLFGLGTPIAAAVGLFHVINHCGFKAALFLTAGIVDHESGTRDLRELGGLWSYMPYTGTLAVLAAAAMAGVPPLNGFISKEMFLEETLHLPMAVGPEWWVPVVATVAALFSMAYSVRFAHGTFFGREPDRFPGSPHEPPRAMRLPVEILVFGCVLIGFFPALVAGPIVQAAAQGVVGAPLPPYELKLWHGFNLPLLMSAIAIVGGALLYGKRSALFGAHERTFPSVAAKRLYDGAVEGTAAISRALTFGLQNGSLQRYLAVFLATALVAGAWPLLRGGGLVGPVPLTPIDGLAVAAWGILVASALGTVAFHRRRILAVVLLSGVGLVVTLAFVEFSAPDLALTQISVEFVTIVLILVVLHLLPSHTPVESSRGRRLRDATLAGAAGLGVAAIVWAVLTRPLESISDFHIAESVPGGGGTNVVNVILVDFRGFDTLGEITVLAIAALTVYALVEGLGLRHVRVMGSDHADEEAHPLMVAVIARLVLPLALVVSLFLFLRGHNEPGGGFIAALVTAVALILQYIAFGVGWTQRRLPRDFHPLVAAGVLTAGLTGVGSWFFGVPFLTSAHDHVHLPLVGDVEWSSAVLFDVGVYLTVVGAVLLILANMSKLDKLAATEGRLEGAAGAPGEP